MGEKLAGVDAYIARAATFAQPILKHLRATVHNACPEVEEALKWGMPFFVYRGSPLCSMAAFKQHCSFGFWKAALVTGTKRGAREGMGDFGKITALADLPPKRTLDALLRKAMALTASGETAARPNKKADKAPPAVPEDLAAAFEHHKAAAATFAAFPPGARREYIEWLLDAKTDATRAKRLATTLEWLTEGKQRHWRYQRAKPAR
jgi:uncharacterized protein YdeI (YjbR/CyaY-like superfamily)